MKLNIKLWNPSAKKFHYDVENVYDCLKAQKVHEGLETRGFTLPYDYISEGYKFILSTGILDKNGKEICGGDLFRGLTESIKCYEVFWDNGMFKMRYLQSNGEYWTWGNIDKCISILEEYNQFEVIGNIFENPELVN
jgi:hypothetical protein